MAINGNLVCKYLNDMKKKHGLSNKRWSDMSGVPLGTINRYMSYNVGVPNFMSVCAMLDCINEPVADFYAAVNVAIENAPQAIIPDSSVVNVAAAVEAAPPDPTFVASMQEAISIQSEVLAAQVQDSHDKDAQINDIRSEVDTLKDEIAQKDVTIAQLETELAQKKKQNRILIIILLVLAVLEVLLANVGFVRGLFKV